MLTVRAFQIANKILVMKRNIRIKDLSEMFQVSDRSIKYDLENIRHYFEDYDLEIKSQSGKGIWIDCTDEKREEMIHRLAKLKQENLYYNQTMRMHMILIYLFSKSDFITAAELADHLNVNRNTILNDIDSICKYLKKTDIELERKQRVGYKLKGKEQDLRSFFEIQIQKSLSAYDVYVMTERIKYKNFEEPIVINLPEEFTKNYSIIESTLHKLFYDHKIDKLQKENITLMIIRLMISMVRIRHYSVIGDRVRLTEDESENYYLYRYWSEIMIKSDLPVYRDEIFYIEGRQDAVISDIDIPAFTSELIKYAAEKNKFPYEQDNTLYSRILSHLTLSLKEEIKENPFNTSILKNHSQLFLAVQEVCHTFLKNNRIIHNDSFISYIVLHFLVSQKNIKFSKKRKAVFVCATGRGAAKLIEKMIESEVQEIEMVASCSLVEAEHIINVFKPDYIFSIFPIEAQVPVIVVEAVPTKENIDYIKKRIKKDLDEWMLEEDEFDNLLDFDLATDAEGISQQIIMKGLNIYHQLSGNKELMIKEDLSFAFLTHCMLLAHRYHFNKQYSNIAGRDESKGIRTVKESLNKIGVHINEDEVQALLRYYL